MPADDPGLARNVDLFELGYVDSAGVVVLVAWLEARYGLELTDADLFDERFTTIDGIASIVADRASGLV